MKAVVTDLEGTITSISFVKDVLFPYARARLPAFVREHAGSPAVAALLDDARALAGGEALDLDAVSDLLVGWIDADRKATPLKALQGMIWARGYAAGELRGHVYPDAAATLRRWHGAKVAIHIYSSGSVEAQQLLLRHAGEGDLTPIVSGYFDTRTGAKAEASSYRAIAGAIDLPPGDLVFFSDTPAELAAATSAGMKAIQICRDGLPADGRYPWAARFDELELGV